MDKRTFIFKELEELLGQLRSVFSDLEAQLSKIDDRFHSAELEFMYGNISEDVYFEKLKRVRQDIARFERKLLRFQALK